jgi:hypothetical protein
MYRFIKDWRGYKVFKKEGNSYVHFCFIFTNGEKVSKAYLMSQVKIREMEC